MPRPNPADEAGYTRSRFDADGMSHDVYRRGDGPAVLLLHEMPAPSWRTVRLAERIRRRGYRVAMPIFTGDVRGRTPRDALRVMSDLAATTIRICVSREFVALAQGRTSPIASWLRALARAEQRSSGRPSVGVIGMCFSGSFALGTAIDATVAIAVASQPALPFAPIGMRWIPGQAADPGVSPADLDRLAARTASGELCVRAYRYSNDWIAPEERIEVLRARLGDGIEYVRIDLPARRHAHPVLSDAATVADDDPADSNGRLALRALDDLLAALDARLKPAGPGSPNPSGS